ncbi:MAG: AmpG family muropeptide MFS transporter [Thermoanaerobaculia bacterium]
MSAAESRIGEARPRGWRGVITAFSTPSALTLLFLGFGSGLPFLLVGYTLSIWLRESGWALGPIGLVSYISFFYVLKFLWAPLLDARRLPLFSRLGRRRGWLFASQLVLVGGLSAMAITGPSVSVPLFLALVGLTALAGATQDTMVDAYRIEIAPIEAQGALAATYVLGYRLGLIAGGALALYIAEYASWRAGYLTMAALAILPAIVTLVAAEPAASERVEAEARPGFVEAYVQPFIEFFRRNRWALAVALLAFVGLFKLPDQMLTIAGPFYLDSGFDKSDIATVSKLYGVWIGIAGAFLGGIAVAALGVRVPLVIAAFAIALSNLLFILMSLYPGELWTFVLTISGDNFAQGFGGPVLVAFMSGLTDKHYTATQYALLSSLANLPGKFIGGLSGYIIEAWSYTGFFIFSTLSILPTLLVLAWLWSRIHRDPAVR